MHFDWQTLALQTINFLILVWLLRRYLFRPVLAAIDARKLAMAETLAEAARARVDAETARDRARALEAEFAASREARMAALLDEAEGLAKARLAKAEAEAGRMIEERRAGLAQEEARLGERAKTAALDLAMILLGKLLADAPDAVRAAAWLDALDAQLAARPEELAAAAGQKLEVVTAAPLAPAEQALWQERLGRRLGGPEGVSFALDPGLAGGVELRLPGRILRLAWQDVLAAAAKEWGGAHDAGR